MAGLDHRPPADAPKNIKEFRAALVKAKGGDAFSQYVICLAYYDSPVVESDIVAAVAWCTRAANQGLVNAQVYLGRFYRQGHGSTLEADPEKALHWFRLAAAQGHSGAQYHIGQYYEGGNLVGRNHQTALEWYQLATRQGHIFAADKLRQIRERYEKFQEYMAQAKAGNAEAQSKVCTACINGFIDGGNNSGVYGSLDQNLIKNDCITAIDWGISAAAQNGNPAAITALKRLREQP